jgi:hypothetical protein
MKSQMKGKRFADVSEMKKKTLEVLKNMSTEEFQTCFQQWEKRWYYCIESKGEYFEGDWSCNGIKPTKPFKKIFPVILGAPPSYQYNPSKSQEILLYRHSTKFEKTRIFEPFFVCLFP